MNDTVKMVLLIILLPIILLSVAAGMIWFERKVLALFQDRHGPNRVGPFGIIQSAADGLKILFKEDWIPPFSDRALFELAPAVVLVATMLSFAIVAFAPRLVIADLNIGILFFLAFSSIGVYSVVIAGWSSNSKYPLLGALRAAGQMFSYEVFLGLSTMGVVMIAGSFDISEIVEAQRHIWFIIPQFFGFIAFVIAGFAETRRLPFDLPEAENELIAGYHTEYSGMKFGLFFIGEYVGITLISSFITLLFLGGWQFPFLSDNIIWFLIKTFLFIAFFILIRASLPRPRYDQLMKFGWSIMLPLVLLNLLITGIVVLLISK